MRWRRVALPIGLVLALILLLHPTGAGRGWTARAKPPARESAERGAPDAAAPPSPSGDRASARHADAARMTIRVDVLDAQSGRPLRGATVEARDGDDLVDSGATDETGFVTLTSDREGVLLLACFRGFLPGGAWASGESTELSIPLVPGLPIAGRVVHADGSPAPGARVDVEFAMNWHLPLRPDALGRFEIPGLTIGAKATVRATEEGCWPEAVVCAVDAASPSVEIVLGRGGVCEGTVVDEKGRPVPGALVAVSERPPDAAFSRTDERGRFSVRGLPPSAPPDLAAWHFRARATTADHRSGESDPFLSDPDGPPSRCEIVVRPYAHVAVALSFPDGSPVAEASVALSAREGWSDQRWCVASARGLFESGKVEPGEQELRVQLPGWPFQRRKISVLPGIRNDVEFWLEEKLGIEGVVVDREGSPVPRVQVRFRPGPRRREPDGHYQVGPHDPAEARMHTAGDGGFLLRGLDAKGTLELEANGYVPLAMDAQPGGPPLRVAIERRPCVAGRILPAPTAAALTTTLGHGDCVTGASVRVARDGRFEIRHAPAGEAFWLMIEAAGSAPWVYAGLKLAPDETLDLGLLEPHDGVTLEGIVRNDAGEPVPDAGVAVDAAIEDLHVYRSARTDEEGRFTITGAADVQSVLRAEASGHVKRLIPIDRPGAAARLEIVLERGGILEIAGDGEDVEIESLDGRGAETVGTAERGTRRVTLRQGLYRIGEKTFEIRAGETTRVDLRD